MSAKFLGMMHDDCMLPHKVYKEKTFSQILEILKLRKILTKMVL